MNLHGGHRAPSLRKGFPMFTCPYCQSQTITIVREHTVSELFTVSNIQPDGTYTEEDAGAFGETVTTSPWQEATCVQCDSDLDIAIVFPAQAAPEPTYVYIVTSTNKYGVDITAYSTEENAWAAVRAIQAEHPQGFDEDDPRPWCDVLQCVVNSSQ